MMVHIKIKAGALQFVVFVGVVVALLLGAFVTLTYTHLFFNKQSSTRIELIKRNNAAISFGLNNTIPFNDSTTVQLPTSDSESSSTTIIHKSHWGLFEKITAISKQQKKEVVKSVLVGGSYKNQQGLYLKDQSRPLVVVGNTYLNGNHALPRAGIKTGNISGNSYYRSQLIYGSSKPSATVLPKLSDNSYSTIESFTKNITHLVDTPSSISYKQGASYQNSFYNTTQVIVSEEHIDLSNTSLKGNIILVSLTGITVTSLSDIADVILIAPTILIKQGSKGRFQAFATKNISVAKNCELEYPSALVVSNRKPIASTNQPHTSAIQLDANTIFKGMILYLENESKKTRPNPQLTLKKNTTVYGEVYSQQYVSLEGVIYGSVYTHGVLSRHLGSTYINHLFNTTIDATQLPEQYTGLLFTNHQKGIAQWLY